MDAHAEFADGVDDRVGLVLHLGADDLVIAVVAINVINQMMTARDSGGR